MLPHLNSLWFNMFVLDERHFSNQMCKHILTTYHACHDLFMQCKHAFYDQSLFQLKLNILKTCICIYWPYASEMMIHNNYLGSSLWFIMIIQSF